MTIPTRAIYCTLCAAILFFLISCSDAIQKNNSYITRLKNRGLVPLSKENPYIAGNALLNKEIENSAELKGFIEHTGAPSAIKVEQGIFSPLYIELYYPAKLEYFSAEENNSTWLINGPYQIDKSTLADINKILIFNSGTQKVELPAQPTEITHPPTPNPAASPTFAAKPTYAPTIAAVIPKAPPVPTQVQLTTEQPDKAATKENIETVPPTAASSLEELVARFGKSKAEITPKGDIVHYVSYPGETVAMLSRWYTFDSSNQQRIMRINHITATQVLSIGDSIVIPGYLVRNRFILTQESLAALDEAVAAGRIK